MEQHNSGGGEIWQERLSKPPEVLATARSKCLIWVYAY